jgi:tRNA threonylcarbamoyladenosine biosynthesis protein TsaE
VKRIVLEMAGIDQTLALGRRLGVLLRTGDVAVLIGPLGAGKTTLTKGIADGAGVTDTRSVNSPTFVIVNEYDSAAGLRLYHIDAYRLRGAGDLEALGFDEMTAGGAVLIEWGDRVADLVPEDHLRVTLELTGDTTRRVIIEASGPRSIQLLDAAASA